MPQLRQNIITGEWVVVAPERAKRPHDFVAATEQVHDDIAKCPFELTAASYAGRYQDFETLHTYMIPNKFPVFVPEGQHEIRSYVPDDSFFIARPAVGGHDLVIIKEHPLRITKLPQEVMLDLLTSIQKRYSYYREDPHVNYVMAIYNHGDAAGASLTHPHSQIFASSVIPDQITKETHGSEKYYDLNGRCVYCDILRQEKKENVRILAENDDFLMFTWFAARFPFETWIVPKVHQSIFEETSPSQLANLSMIFRQGLGMLDTTLHNPALNFYIHSLPTTSEGADYYHWHIEIAPRVSKYGGFEIGGGTIIDVVSPEQAAGFLTAKAE